MLLGSQYSHLRSHFSLPMGSRNDFYFIFWNDHARFCVGEHGGLYASPSSDQVDFITQRLRKNRFFVKKKTIFLGVMQAVFDYATLFFIVFGPFFLA